MKSIPLINTNLKEFIRDWKSVLLLIGFPLLIVGLIFSSFGINTLNIPVGTVQSADGFNYDQFEQKADRFAEVRKYYTVRQCLEDTRKYEVYSCIVIEERAGESQYGISVHYDNTKEIVGQRVTTHIRRASREMEVKYSEKKAEKALSEVSQLTSDIRRMQEKTQRTDQNLKKEIDEIDDRIQELKEVKREFRSERSQMDSDVEEAERDLDMMERNRRNFYNTASYRIDRMQSIIDQVEEYEGADSYQVDRAQSTLTRMDRELEEYNNNAKRQIESYNQMINNYKDFSRKSDQYLQQIDQTIRELKATREDLKEYRQDLSELDRDLERTEQKYSETANMRPEQLASSVSINKKPVYSPNKPTQTVSSQLVTLQTIFSTLLLLVSIFVSLLVSQFVALKSINSPARDRLKMVENVFLAEHIAIYASSMLIITIPIICVLIFGQYFFQLPIFNTSLQTGVIGLILFLLATAIVKLGTSIAYLVKEKSTTLLIGSFLLVFLIFFSGFVLPIELMQPTSGHIASILPTSTSLKAFDLIVLYNQPPTEIKTEIGILGGWSVFLTALSLAIKKFKLS